MRLWGWISRMQIAATGTGTASRYKAGASAAGRCAGRSQYQLSCTPGRADARCFCRAPVPVQSEGGPAFCRGCRYWVREVQSPLTGPDALGALRPGPFIQARLPCAGACTGTSAVLELTNEALAARASAFALSRADSPVPPPHPRPPSTKGSEARSSPANRRVACGTPTVDRTVTAAARFGLAWRQGGANARRQPGSVIVHVNVKPHAPSKAAPPEQSTHVQDCGENKEPHSSTTSAPSAASPPANPYIG